MLAGPAFPGWPRRWPAAERSPGPARPFLRLCARRWPGRRAVGRRQEARGGSACGPAQAGRLELVRKALTHSTTGVVTTGAASRRTAEPACPPPLFTGLAMSALDGGTADGREARFLRPEAAPLRAAKPGSAVGPSPRLDTMIRPPALRTDWLTPAFSSGRTESISPVGTMIVSASPSSSLPSPGTSLASPAAPTCAKAASTTSRRSPLSLTTATARALRSACPLTLPSATAVRRPRGPTGYGPAGPLSIYSARSRCTSKRHH